MDPTEATEGLVPQEGHKYTFYCSCGYGSDRVISSQELADCLDAHDDQEHVLSVWEFIPS